MKIAVPPLTPRRPGHLRAIWGLWAEVLEMVGVLDMNGYDLISMFLPYIK